MEVGFLSSFEQILLPNPGNRVKKKPAGIEYHQQS